MDQDVVVLGARQGNIGGAIAETLGEHFRVETNDCFFVDDFHEYDIPLLNWSVFDAIVVTLGVTHMEPIHEVDALNIEKVIRGCLTLPLQAVAEYSRHRVRSRLGGKIVLVGSYANDHPFTHCTSYCAAKAGLDMACKSLAWELGTKNFQVHIVHPHHVQGTPMTDEVRKGMQEGIHKMTREETVEYMEKDLRMPEILKPQEIADVVCWLLTDPAAEWTSGTGIRLYGGVR